MKCETCGEYMECIIGQYYQCKCRSDAKPASVSQDIIGYGYNAEVREVRQMCYLFKSASALRTTFPFTVRSGSYNCTTDGDYNVIHNTGLEPLILEPVNS